MIDAIAIGSLKNWPSENNEGTKNNLSYFFVDVDFLSLFENLFTFYFSITAYVFSV